MFIDIIVFFALSIIFFVLFFYQKEKKNTLSIVALVLYSLQVFSFIGVCLSGNFIDISFNLNPVFILSLISYFIGYYILTIIAYILLFISCKKYKVHDEKIKKQPENKKFKKRKEKNIKEKKKIVLNNKKKLIIICCSLLIILIIGLYFLIDYIVSLKKQVENYKDRYNSLKNDYSSLSDELSSLRRESFKNSQKLQFYDNHIVFVIEGYGNYYYTYDEMKNVTSGKRNLLL